MIYWIRHCATTGQAPEAPLTSTGHAQAQHLADVLAPFGITRIVSSPYRRALQSIEPFAARTGITVEPDGRIRERLLSTEPLADVRLTLKHTFDDADFAAPGGETSREATARASAAFSDIMSAGSTTAVVSHGNLTSLLLRRLGWPMDFDASLRLTNPDLFRIDPIDATVTITRLWH